MMIELFFWSFYITQNTQNIEFRSFFGKIENTIFFQDLLTFIYLVEWT